MIFLDNYKKGDFLEEKLGNNHLEEPYTCLTQKSF